MPPPSLCLCSPVRSLDFRISMLGVDGYRRQYGTGACFLAPGNRAPATRPHPKTQHGYPAALVSELWNEEARLGPLPWLSCPRALPIHASNCSPCPGQHLPAYYVDSWFSRPVSISMTNEMEASARQAWRQQGRRLRNKSSRAWHPLCFLSQGPAGQTSTAVQWRDV